MRSFTVAVVCCLAILLVGCKDVRREFSETLHEEAVIENVVYTPSKHESRVEPSIGGSGAIGFGPSGIVIRMGKSIQITNVTVPEKFALGFRCQHGQFIISRKEVYEKFKDHKGNMVDVTYHEVYKTTYDTKDGEKQVVARELTDYNFLNATLK